MAEPTGFQAKDMEAVETQKGSREGLIGEWGTAR